MERPERQAVGPRGLAWRLSQYEVSSTKVRLGESTAQGYRSEDLFDARQRYVRLFRTMHGPGRPPRDPRPPLPRLPPTGRAMAFLAALEVDAVALQLPLPPAIGDR